MRKVILSTPAEGVCWVGGCGGLHLAAGSSDEVRKAHALAPAQGWYAIGGGPPAVFPTKGQATTEARKRARASDLSAVAKAVGRDGDQVLVEFHRTYRTAHRGVVRKAAMTAGARAYQASTGRPIEVDVAKLLNPFKAKDFDTIVSSIGSHMARNAGMHSDRALRSVVESIKFDWARATDAKLLLLSQRLNNAMRIAAGKTWVEVRGKLYIEGQNTAEASRKAMVEEHHLRIGTNLAQQDLGTIRHITASHAHYVTDFYSKQVAPRLSQRARTIVRDGTAQGFGTREIAKDLYQSLGSSLKGRELPYFNAVANAYVARSRSYSALVTMKESGITHYIASAVLDEITTDFCRYIDGRTLSVEHGIQQFVDVEASPNPEAVKDIQPWARNAMIKSGADKGKMGMFMGRGEKRAMIAVIEKSGVGKVNERGSYSKGIRGKELEGAGVGTPPYHGACRTIVIPDIKSPEYTRVRMPVSMPVPYVPKIDGNRRGAPPTQEVAAARDARTAEARDSLEQRIREEENLRISRLEEKMRTRFQEREEQLRRAEGEAAQRSARAALDKLEAQFMDTLKRELGGMELVKRRAFVERAGVPPIAKDAAGKAWEKDVKSPAVLKLRKAYQGIDIEDAAVVRELRVTPKAQPATKDGVLYVGKGTMKDPAELKLSVAKEARRIRLLKDGKTPKQAARIIDRLKAEELVP